MKQFAAFQWSGFQGSIELCRFLDSVTDDLIEAICAVVGTNTAFVKGGIINVVSGSTTVTDGIIIKDGKLYSFTGGTYVGIPSALKILFEEKTAATFPQPKFVNDNVPKDIYLDRTCKIDASGTLFLNTIGRLQTLQSTNDSLVTQVNTINTALDGKVDKGIIWKTGVGSVAVGLTALEASRPYGRWCNHPSGVIYVELDLKATSAITAGTRLFEVAGLALPGYIWRKYMPFTLRSSTGSVSLGHLQFSESSNYDILGNPSSGYRMDITTLTAIPVGSKIQQTFVLIP